MDEEEYETYDEDYYEDDYGPEPECHTCGGSGWVESLAEERGDWLCYEDKPGDCPNCKGSGLRKDCTYF